MSDDARVRVWRYDPTRDARPDSAQPGDIDDRRAVLLAAPEGAADAVAWMAVDDYDGEATVLFAAPSGELYSAYVSALLGAALQEARRLGVESLLAHWRAGWFSATATLTEAGFAETAPGIWRREL